MSLQDIDDMQGAVRDTARVLEGGGRFVVAVVHPFDSAHEIDRQQPETRLVMTDYFDRRHYRDEIERDGLTMTFESRHWTLEDYFDAVLSAGLQIEKVREIPDPEHPLWSRIPLFLHLVAAKAVHPG
jgi:ubiquinone/menaquinone biosynthesis C-methylase UbiE